MGTPDGGSHTSHGAYAPAARSRSVARELALCDLKQAQSLRAWAERIERASGGSSDSRSTELVAVAREMAATALVIETYTERLLDEIGGKP